MVISEAEFRPKRGKEKKKERESNRTNKNKID